MAVLNDKHAVMLIAGSVALWSTSCVREPVGIDMRREAVQVHSVLLEGDSMAVVLVALAQPDKTWLSPISGVTGVITRGEESFPLRERGEGQGVCLRTGPDDEPTSRGCYEAVVVGGIRSGEAFSLSLEGDIRVREVSARSVIPGPLHVDPERAQVDLACSDSKPLCEGDGIQTIGHVELLWSGGALVGWIEIAPVVTTAFLSGRSIPDADCWISSGDLNQAVPPGSGRVRVDLELVGCVRNREPVMFDSLEGGFAVFAYDTAYARYQQAFQDGAQVAGQTAASAGVSGAFGYFVGAAETMIPFTMRRTP